ncbi:phage portal protein [Clostridium tyrobutyricum]|uniref:phage portal protein n=1 Tax=Clostridium tyrobutyricum TaxID=1519 RepID=UPI001C37FFC0|nr:phage portal protein [Clostridium tyrobutyricum]MBV4427141.1 phage portal protein [Clostridium tyrobutyricum]MBV4442132.1 phage portal protein [Clostridium tyrobutyricum]MBV4442297.1 phage portal protein [Clostridium tyrobutyricum]MBV4450153.1 phage portal protein [Clostridium tyrobutyricum]
MALDIELVKKCYGDFSAKAAIYNRMYEYYKGNTDAITNYKMVTERSNNRVACNFIKKFIKEEVSYLVGNDIAYISKSGNDDIVNDIEYNLGHWSEKHDGDLVKQMLIYGFAFELYYLDRSNQFSSRIITPREGYAYTDDLSNVLFFMHIFTKKFDSTTYIDVYDSDYAYHFDSNFNELEKPTAHIFGGVPVGVAQVSEEFEDDTIYKDIKGLQDAFETNLSDISNEISDFRNAYLAISGFKIDDKDIPDMKQKGIIQIPTADGKATWIIKNINDQFIQNTLSTMEDKMYQLASHINHNEKMQSNLSGMALRSRLISLEEKCKLNQKATADCIKVRLNMLFNFLNYMNSSVNYDYRDIKLKFTPNIPQDDLNSAQIVSQLEDKLSLETGLSLFSFVDNPKNEIKKIKQENKDDSIGQSLLNGGEGDGTSSE